VTLAGNDARTRSVPGSLSRACAAMFTSACDWKPPRHADPLPAPCRAGKPLRRPVADAVAGGNGLCMDIGRKRSAAFDSSAREPDRRPPTGAV